MEKFRLALGILVTALAILLAMAAERGTLKVEIGPERIILPKGLQPFMLQSNKGTLLVEGMMPEPPGFVAPNRNWGWLTEFIRSTDGGNTWKSWTPAAAQGRGPVFEGDGVQLKDGTILILDWTAEGPKDGGYFIGKLWESHDEWQTLSGPAQAKIYLPNAITGYDDGGRPMPGIWLHRTMIEMQGGELLATAYGWFKGDSTPSAYMKNQNKFRCFLLGSKDRGHNWYLVSTIAVDPTVGEEGFDEPVLVRVPQGNHKGRFIVHMRTGRFNPVYQTESDDQGNTWTKPHPLPFHGVSPDLVEMKNGILVAGFGWRTEEAYLAPGKERPSPRLGFYVAFSLDQGTTWTQLTQVNNELTTSYAAIKEVRPGRLILVYDKSWWGHTGRALAARFIDVRE
jgi:hypothetical protein